MYFIKGYVAVTHGKPAVPAGFKHSFFLQPGGRASKKQTGGRISSFVFIRYYRFLNAVA